MILFELVGDQLGPLGWSFYHFLWQGMLVAALYSVACLLCGDNARRRYALASLFLVVAIVLPGWQIWMILARHHGLALGIGPPESLLPWMTFAALQFRPPGNRLRPTYPKPQPMSPIVAEFPLPLNSGSQRTCCCRRGAGPWWCRGSA